MLHDFSSLPGVYNPPTNDRLYTIDLRLGGLVVAVVIVIFLFWVPYIFSFLSRMVGYIGFLWSLPYEVYNH